MKKDELFERRSGLINNYVLKELKEHSFELFNYFMFNIKSRGGSISFKMASEIAGRITAEMMRGVYTSINVKSIGDDARNLKVAEEYSKRLAEKFQNLKPDCIARLIHHYASHDFVIDAEEATLLFHRVEAPSPLLFDLLTEHRQIMLRPSTQAVVKYLLPRTDEQNADGESEG